MLIMTSRDPYRSTKYATKGRYDKHVPTFETFFVLNLSTKTQILFLLVAFHTAILNARPVDLVFNVVV
jgi:hypothetical protein